MGIGQLHSSRIGALWYTAPIPLISHSMLTLYVKTGCPFCAKVLATGEELGIDFNLKNVADEAISDELVARGGKRQMPYLIDEARGVEMYESDAINEYLHQYYGKTA
jgi:glutathione S-transferase